MSTGDDFDYESDFKLPTRVSQVSTMRLPFTSVKMGGEGFEPPTYWV
jgi:hypothetical protein